jgi:hypothetical protein
MAFDSGPDLTAARSSVAAAGHQPAIAMDCSQWPFVFSSFDGPLAVPDLESYIQRFSALWNRKQNYVSILYIRAYSRDQQVIQRLVRWMKESEDLSRQYCMGTALLSTSGAFRFLLSSIFLLKKMPVPYQVCGSFAEAVAFGRSNANKRGLTLPMPKRPWDDWP